MRNRKKKRGFVLSRFKKKMKAVDFKRTMEGLDKDLKIMCGDSIRKKRISGKLI